MKTIKINKKNGEEIELEIISVDFRRLEETRISYCRAGSFRLKTGRMRPEKFIEATCREGRALANISEVDTKALKIPQISGPVELSGLYTYVNKGTHLRAIIGNVREATSKETPDYILFLKNKGNKGGTLSEVPLVESKGSFF